jgi:hypothetical protein
MGSERLLANWQNSLPANLNRFININKQAFFCFDFIATRKAAMKSKIYNLLMLRRG